jgi:hypothetical protein
LQRQRAIQFPFSQFDLGAGVRKLTFGLRGHRFERTGVDKIQEVAGTDKSAITEFDGRNEAADAGTNLNLLNRIEPSRELVPVRDSSLDGLGDGDRRGRGRSLRRLLFLAAREKPREHNKDWRKAIEWTDIGHSRRTRRLLSRAHFVPLKYNRESR